MDTKELERFCPWARQELVGAVMRGMVQLGVDEAGRAQWPAGSEAVAGRALSPEERTRRDRLMAAAAAAGDTAFAEREAYSWFNRLMALRYMELHGLLPWGGRALSAADGSFAPELATRAADLPLASLDRAAYLERAAESDDEGAFRLALEAACAELAGALPGVFEGASCDLLPKGLLSRGEHNVIQHLVEDVPEDSWENVEALGWAYQFYNSERKDDFFKSKRKAAAEDIAPATQLFTPDWIVRYMVQNSLGRLWMLNNPESPLRDKMEFYIESDAEHEDFLRVSGPEEITFCDPACGSGHILVYAFQLLTEMYRERGWRDRDIARSILESNLSGYEIDPRAAQIAQTALCMEALSLDRRWLSRGVSADVRVLGNIQIDRDALDPASALREAPQLLDALGHLGEIGSLLEPSPDDLGALKAELMHALSGDLFVTKAQDGVKDAHDACEALSRRFDVVVANPPYMGSSSFNPFVAKWIKKHYPDSCRDLCTAFIEREIGMAKNGGFSALITSDTCMYLSSFESLRKKIINENTLLSLIDTRGTNAHPDVFDANAGWILRHGHSEGYRGHYFKLNHKIEEKGEALLEAIQNPDCGWFHRADASTFHDIPGSPIAYWVGKGLLNAFEKGGSIDEVSDYTGSPNITGDNDKFLRFHWECPACSCASNAKWIPYSKGGNFRKWYGNVVHVVDWTESARSFYRDNKTSTLLPEKYWFKGGITYTMLTSGMPCFRHFQDGGVFDKSGPVICNLGLTESVWLAFLNSSVAAFTLGLLNPTMNLQVRDVKALPALDFEADRNQIDELARQSISLSRSDWDSQETSWDFKRNPLV